MKFTVRDTQTDFSVHDISSFIFTGAGAVTIESISYGVKGKFLKLINLTGSILTLKHDTGSVAKNKIITPEAADLVITNNQSVNLFYDHVSARWKIDGSASSGGSGGKTITAVQTGPYTTANNEIVRMDSTGGEFTITLPLTPSNATEIELVDVGGAAALNNITIERNGELINGSASNVVFDVDYARTILIYSSSLGWSLQ